MVIKRKKIYVILCLLCMVFAIAGGTLVSNANEKKLSVTYRARSGKEWNTWRMQGQYSTDTDEPLTGFLIRMSDNQGRIYNSDIFYSIYSDDTNWLPFANGGKSVRTNFKPIKAIKIRLAEEINYDYKVEYRAQTSNGRWLSWKSDGIVCGNVYGNEYLIDVQVKVVRINNTYGSTTRVSMDETSSETNGAKYKEIEIVDSTGKRIVETEKIKNKKVVDNVPVTQEETGAVSNGSMEAGQVTVGYSTPSYTTVDYQNADVPYEAKKMVQIALSEVGVKENNDGTSKYGIWYDNNISNEGFSSGAWCAMFVTWCANQAGISSNVIAPYAYCPYGVQNFSSKGQYYTDNNYQPKTGDIIFFSMCKGRSDHTGIVIGAKDGYVHTVEGNTQNAVKIRGFRLDDSRIVGYASPYYN